MSDLQRAWAKAKYSISNDTFDEVDEEHENDVLPELPEPVDDDSSSASSASSVSSTGTIIPSPNQKLFARPQGVARGRTLEQIPWTTYFERELSLKSEQEPEVVYHAYLTSPVGKGPLFVMHHGAGSSGLSFAVVASEIKKRLSTAGILAIDCRGHGSTNAPGDKALDMRLDILSSDLFSMVQLTKNEMAWSEMPPIVLVGHSLGGAVVTDLAKSGRLGTSVLGYAVLDVVEGSAIDALQSMHTYLSTRPLGFATLQAGIEWHIRSRTIRNSISARTSVPALLVFNENDDPTRPWRWRTNLGATQPYWEGWFIGLSKKFLGAKGGKLLLLAGTDRLDTELTIGQMQG
ncbi:protein phosphatase methylesterase 1 [Fusarium oxysporum f. sp. vasinfectum 25433]|nr:protein phosphatase methylesterase 1 [Fusarium oxysporum f. sp. vasinfectum 25433]